MNNGEHIFSSIEGLLTGEVTKNIRKVSSGIVPLKIAPNPVIFAESEEFLGTPELYPFQFKTLRNFFELLCPFCNDINRIIAKDDIPRDEQVLYEYDRCPECGYYKYSDISNLSLYNELAGCGGMRGAKSALAAIMAHWLTHETLCCDNLQEKLGLIKDQTLEGAFVAVSAEQAEETVWDHFTKFYRNSSWYQDYTKKLRALEKTNDYQAGELIQDRGAKELVFGDRHLRLKALHSNSGSLAGKTRLFAIIDELARFDSGESRRSAIEVYRVMLHSLQTLQSASNRLYEDNRYEVPIPRMISISSPIFEHDLIMRLAVKEIEDQPKRYTFHAPTWIMNPHITREDLADKYRSDPLGAERDFGANPPGAESPLIDDPKLVDIAVDKSRQSMFDHKDRYFDLEAEGVTFNYVGIDLINVRYSNLAEYVIHIDPGRNKDSYGMAIAHNEGDMIIIDGVLECRPIPKGNKQGVTPRQVYFPGMSDLIIELGKKLTIRLVSYDRWSSIEQIDKLRKHKILAVGENLDREDHLRFVESLRNRKISFPKKEATNRDPYYERGLPIAKAIKEIKSLNDDGKKVDHPPEGYNDLAQCVVGCHRLIMSPEKVINPKQLREEQKKKLAARRLGRKIGRVVKLGRHI